MDRGVAATVRLLPESNRKDLAIQALTRSETVSDLAARHGVSRKFVYQQTHKARAALDDAFSPAAPGGEVLFELAVTGAWLRQVIVGLTLICCAARTAAVSSSCATCWACPSAWAASTACSSRPGGRRA